MIQIFENIKIKFSPNGGQRLKNNIFEGKLSLELKLNFIEQHNYLNNNFF